MISSSHEFLRYSCQLVLPGFDESKQQLLKQAKVLIVGAGAWAVRPLNI